MCGLWDSGLGGRLAPNRLILAGARDLDPDEKDLIRSHEVHLIPPADGEIDVDAVLRATDGRPVFVHLDLDVLNPGLLPTEYQVAGGVTPSGVRELFMQLAESSEIAALSVAELNFAAERFDTDCETVFSMIEPLTRRITAAVR
jgi:arginase family enzyme